MIMQERTPRSLTWAGCVAVLALGLLLPLAPVLGQETPKNQKGDQSDKDARDEYIEALKKAVKFLEEQKNAEKRNAYIKDLNDLQKHEEKRIEIYTAQLAVDQLTKQVKVKRNELKDLEAKLEAAQQRLNKLNGKKEQSKGLELKPIDLRRNYQYHTVPLEVQVQDLQPFEVQVEKMRMPEFQLQWVHDPSQPVKLDQKPSTQDKKGDLEQRVDKLLKEVEELKRELQKQKPARKRIS